MDLTAALLAETRRQQRGLASVALEHVELLGGVAGWAGPGSWANQAVGVGLDGPVTDAELDALVHYYESRGAEARVEVLPVADPTLVRGLAARGFVVDRFENVWFRELPAGEDLRGLLPHGWPDATFDLVRPGEERLFTELAGSGFVAEGERLPDADLEIGLRMLQNPGVVAIVARVDGEPAGAGAGAVDGGFAGLFGASVLPRFRRRGLQSGLIVARMEHLRAGGAHTACIESSPGIPTERNARRLGFELAATKVALRRPNRSR